MSVNTCLTDIEVDPRSYRGNEIFIPVRYMDIIYLIINESLSPEVIREIYGYNAHSQTTF